jgi:hypothetical protein
MYKESAGTTKKTKFFVENSVDSSFEDEERSEFNPLKLK